MSSVNQLAYVGIEVSDLADWERFGVDLLGMQLGFRSSDSLQLRMDDKVYRWLIQKGTADDLSLTGFECGSDADLDAIVARLQAAGHQVQQGDAALAEQRQVQRIFVTVDPLGNRVELVTGFATASTPFVSKTLKSSFVTGFGGAGHQVLMERGINRQQLMDWYGLLGFKLTDVIDEKLAPDFIASVAFMHCNGRHHTLALANMPFPKRIHHFMVEVSSMDDVGHAYDRCMDDRRQFEMTLGVHPNDQMFSFYVRTPSGFNVEFGWGGLVIDEQTWQVQHLDHLSSWGHRHPKAVAELLQA